MKIGRFIGNGERMTKECAPHNGFSVMRKRMTALLACILLLCMTTSADSPYKSFTYSNTSGKIQAVMSPIPYAPESTINAGDMGVRVSDLSDLIVDPSGGFLICDAGANQILRLDKDMNLTSVISTFGDGDNFNQPKSLFIDHEGQIFVADCENQRIVILDRNGELKRIIEKPKSELFSENYAFHPLKVAVNAWGHIFLVVKDDYNGLMELDADGKFIGYIGSSPVSYDPIQLLWKRFMTAAQREKMVLFLPIEYTSVHLDYDEFFLAVSKSSYEKKPIKRMNAAGKDIFASTVDTGTEESYVDICSDSNGNIFALDAKNGRINAYTNDGTHLYTFGSLGNRFGTFRSPIAIECLDDKLYVLDSTLKNITVFEMTPYAQLIRKGNELYERGEYHESRLVWEQVLQLNTNFEYAYVQVGKALCWEERYEEAMAYFVKGNFRGNEVFAIDGYNRAFQEYRSKLFLKYMPVLLTLVLVCVVIVFAVSVIKRMRTYAKNQGS